MADRLWILTAFFNPTHTALRVQNYRQFRARLLAQGGRLLTIELAFRDDPFQLQAADAHRLIQVRSDSVMWQKERLLNIGLDHLPDACEAVAWLDCDILFIRDEWLREARQGLERFPIVQPYDYAVRLGPRMITTATSALPYGRGILENDEGIGSQAARGALRSARRYDRTRWGHCGFAWCGRREIVARHRLYDRAILGSGDLYMAAAFLRVPMDDDLPTAPLRQDYRRWADAVHADVGGRLACVPGTVLHLWHGPRALRLYDSRRAILAQHAFDPAKDLALNCDQCWEWASAKRAMHRAARHYFSLRHEDGAIGPLTRAVLQEPGLVCRALWRTGQAHLAGWLKRRVPLLSRAGQAVYGALTRRAPAGRPDRPR